MLDLSLTDEQQLLVDAFAGLLAKHSTAEQVRAAEPTGFDSGLWGQLCETGAVAMAVGESAGGWGAELLDLALIAEQSGRALASAPAIEAQVAVRLLDRLDGTAAASTLASIIEDGRLATVALHPAVGAAARMVPAGAVADVAIVRSGDALVVVELDGQRTPVMNLGSMPVADVAIPANPTLLAEGPGAIEAFESALDDWLTLTGSALVGLAARSLEIGVEYVKERHAWGVPIGSFQSIAHRLADSATAIDAAELVTREAAWAAAAAPDRHGELAAMGFSLAYEAARDATYRSLHFHGGYGFMMEYDIQLYYRRARGWATVFGGPLVVHRRIADQRYGPIAAVS